MLLIILGYSVLLGCRDPLKSDGEGINSMIGRLEPVFTGIFCLDVLLMHAHDGVRRYWTGQDWRWNQLDFFVVCVGVIGFLPGVDSNLGILRMIRVLR